jgi:hypothetical protein
LPRFFENSLKAGKSARGLDPLSPSVHRPSGSGDAVTLSPVVSVTTRLPEPPGAARWFVFGTSALAPPAAIVTVRTVTTAQRRTLCFTQSPFEEVAHQSGYPKATRFEFTAPLES